MQGLAGTVNLASAQTAIANSIIGQTGLGNIGAITGSFGPATAAQFTESIKGAIIAKALPSLNSLGTNVNIAAIQNSIATKISGITGMGNIAAISGSLTNINAAAITSAIKDSAIQNALAQIPNLGTLSAANIQNLIAGQISGITGFANVAAISGAINANIATALGGIMNVQNQLTTVLGSLQTELASLTNLSGLISNNVLASLPLSSLTNITTSIANIQGTVLNQINLISTNLTTSVASISTAAGNIFTTGVASVADLSNISLADTSASAATASVASDTDTSKDSSRSASSASRSDTGGTPFGGLSTFVWYCTCSVPTSIAVTINDYTVGSSLSQPITYVAGATVLYPYGQIFTPGPYVLGLWQAGGSCQYYVGTGCSTYNVDGQMLMVGTSM